MSKSPRQIAAESAALIGSVVPLSVPVEGEDVPLFVKHLSIEERARCQDVRESAGRGVAVALNLAASAIVHEDGQPYMTRAQWVAYASSSAAAVTLLQQLVNEVNRVQGEAGEAAADDLGKD